MRPVIAYPGVAGSFSESAAQCAFPQGETRGYATFAQAAEAAQNGAADYALLPVENSFAGAVLPTYGLLEGLSLHIVGETLRRVRHQLVALPGATIEGLRTISSHPQAIAQCDAFLATVPWARLVPSANTAISAQEVAASGDLTLAAPDKATVVFRVNDEVGALARVLTSFAENGLNMSRIESRPLPETPFQYFFSADFVGAMDAAHLRGAMDKARPLTGEIRLLGVYPRGQVQNP